MIESNQQHSTQRNSHQQSTSNTNQHSPSHDPCIPITGTPSHLFYFKLATQYAEGIDLQLDYDKALSLFHKAAEKGNINAYNAIAKIYSSRHISKIDEVQCDVEASKFFQLGAQEYSRLCEVDPAAANYVLGVQNMYGQGCKINMKKALNYLMSSAEQGNSLAIFTLGEICEQGIQVNSKDIPSAIIWYEKAVSQGEPSSMRNLGNIYLGESYQNTARGIELLERASQLGDPEAMNSLGMYYFKLYSSTDEGKLKPQNLEIAEYFFKRSIEFGSVFAMENEADLLDSIGRTKEAIDLYGKALNAGVSNAGYKLGYMYENGHGVPWSFEKAIEFYTKGANAGSGKSCWRLGFLYQKGKGTKSSFSKAVQFYLKAIENGCTDAYISIGEMYQYGNGFKQNYTRALDYYRVAMNGGNPNAAYNMAVFYKYGWGTTKDEKKAAEFYKKAAEGNHINGLINYGNLCRNGIFVPQDYQEAMRCYLKAHQISKSPEAASRIAEMYSAGLGVEKNQNEANSWKRIAENDEFKK